MLDVHSVFHEISERVEDKRHKLRSVQERESRLELMLENYMTFISFGVWFRTENAVLQARIDELKSEIENNKQAQRREIEQKFEALHAVNMHFSEISRTKEKFLHDAEKEVEEVFEEANLQSNAETRQLEVDHETVRVYLERLQAMERTLSQKLKGIEEEKKQARKDVEEYGKKCEETQTAISSLVDTRVELEERKHALLLRLSQTDHVEDEIRNVQAKIDSLNARLREERGYPRRIVERMSQVKLKQKHSRESFYVCCVLF
ncbi:hypothetical protein BLNAU_17052 [Blattamonas nauphoetae]|uniref:Uncharacterized protein n=1 Tax=Blattamonas nauphoetae TaxID=2049346 RepID=A0ABQ9X7S9_9EUKA|nr:hypothetical protein BLNAU_17052 [Blattamonas nauphoetae]